jgi:predicted lipoprotein with Yx(FWY)xxD motif
VQRIHILGGVLAAALLTGGGAALGVALAGPPVPAAAAPATSSAAPAPSGIGTAALRPGTALVDGTGHALYLFDADTGTTSTCTGACAQVWPPLLAGDAAPGATGGAQAALLGTSQRADGTSQVTYAGHPLYRFAGDTGPGEVRGQGIHNFGGGWYVVAPDGRGIDPGDAPAARPAPAAAPGTGSAY